MEITSLSQLDLQHGRYTYADYLTWKFEQAVELIKGKIWAMSAPSTRHQSISMRLSYMLYKHFINEPCGLFAAPFDVRLFDTRKSAKANKDVHSVVQPDLCVVCDKSKLDDKGCLGAPDLIIEILSPGNSTKEMKAKKQLYEENGVREYLVVSPENNLLFQMYLQPDDQYSPVKIYTPEDSFASAIFPELSLDLEAMFEAF